LTEAAAPKLSFANADNHVKQFKLAPTEAKLEQSLYTFAVRECVFASISLETNALYNHSSIFLDSFNHWPWSIFCDASSFTNIAGRAKFS